MLERYFSEKMKEIVVGTLGLKNITPKSLRRWFNTHLEKNSIRASIIRRLMGHKGDIGDKHYNQIFIDAKEGEYEELALFYSENIDPLISLGNGNKKYTKIDKEVEQLKAFNKDLVEQLNISNKKIDDLEELTSKIPKLEQTINIILGKISDKDIIETLGIKEFPKKTPKKRD